MASARYSKAVEQASDFVREAEDRLLAEMETAYPKGARVRVIHSRGAYFGVVAGHSTYGRTIDVTNANSGKMRGCWYQEVEVISVSNRIQHGTRCICCGCVQDRAS